MVLRYKDIHVLDNCKTMKIIYSSYKAGEVSVHRACCERATQPYSLGVGGGVGVSTIYPGSRPAGVTTRSQSRFCYTVYHIVIVIYSLNREDSRCPMFPQIVSHVSKV